MKTALSICNRFLLYVIDASLHESTFLVSFFFFPLIKDEALIAAATLSDRYIADRKQPDKAIDLIDEACSRLRLEQESKPEAIWKVSAEYVKYSNLDKLLRCVTTEFKINA